MKAFIKKLSEELPDLIWCGAFFEDGNQWQHDFGVKGYKTQRWLEVYGSFQEHLIDRAQIVQSFFSEGLVEITLYHEKGTLIFVSGTHMSNMEQLKRVTRRLQLQMWASLETREIRTESRSESLRDMPGICVNRITEASGEEFVEHIVNTSLTHALAKENHWWKCQHKVPSSETFATATAQPVNDQIIIRRPFIQGKSLAQLIQQNKKVSLKQSMLIVRSILKTLQPFHEQNIPHGNLQPNNIFLTRQRQIVLVDSGLNTLMDDDKIPEGLFKDEGRPPVGNWSFLAPEQLRNEPAIIQSDYWALGQLLCYCLSGTGLTTVHNRGHQLIIAQDLLLIAQGTLCKTHPEIEKLLLELLQEKPEQRATSVSGLIHHIDDIISLQKAVAV